MTSVEKKSCNAYAKIKVGMPAEVATRTKFFFVVVMYGDVGFSTTDTILCEMGEFWEICFSTRCSPELLLVDLGFFICHIYLSETEQLSVLYTETSVPWLPLMIFRKLTRWFVDTVLSYLFIENRCSEILSESLRCLFKKFPTSCSVVLKTADIRFEQVVWSVGR